MLLRQHFHLGRDDVPRCLAGSSHESPKFNPLAIWVHTLKMNPKVSLSIHKFRITELPSQPNTTSLLSCGYFQVAAVLQKSTQNVNQTWPPNLLLWVTEKMWPRAQDPTQRQLGSSWITCAGRSIERFPSRNKIGGLQTDRSRFPDYFYLFHFVSQFSLFFNIYGNLWGIIGHAPNLKRARSFLCFTLLDPLWCHLSKFASYLMERDPNIFPCWADRNWFKILKNHERGAEESFIYGILLMTFILLSAPQMLLPLFLGAVEGDMWLKVGLLQQREDPKDKPTLQHHFDTIINTPLESFL
jgi:hypothetical protein